jgi:hypothetical protein
MSRIDNKFFRSAGKKPAAGVIMPKAGAPQKYCDDALHFFLTWSLTDVNIILAMVKTAMGNGGVA